MSTPRSFLRPGSLLVLLSCLAGILAAPPPCAADDPPRPNLTAEKRAQLAEAAANPVLAPWQREVMLRLAHGGDQATVASVARITPTVRFTQAAGASDGSWYELSSSGRATLNAVYDSARNRILAFGGFDLDALRVWELSLAGALAWRQLTPIGKPPCAGGFSVILDPARDRLLLFGGWFGPDVLFNRVWSLSLSDTSAWTELDPVGTLPYPRQGHGAIYDPVRDRMLVFGGWACIGREEYALQNDVWALSLSGTPQWTPLTPTGPPPSARGWQTMTYDPIRDRMMMFGGFDGSSDVNDLWALSLSGTPQWAALAAAGTPPGGGMSATSIYDPHRDRLLVYRGTEGTTTLNDVWTLGLSGTPTWATLGPTGLPPFGGSAIYDSIRDRMLVAGVSGASCDQDGVWALSLNGDPQWATLLAPTPTDTLPGAREEHSAVYDPLRDRMVVFGGRDDARNDVWALPLTGRPDWTELRPAGTPPSPRYGHSAIYDPARDRMVIYGGWSGTAVVNDVWALSLTSEPTWAALSPAGPPPSARARHSAIYDPVRSRMVVFGGSSNTQRLTDVWVLSLAGAPVWARLSPAGTPPSRGSAIYETVRDRMIVFDESSGDVSALSLAGANAWTQVVSSGTTPGPRDGASTIYDPVRDRMVVFGGGYYRNDAWALALAGTPQWSQLAPLGTMTNRTRHSAIYDPLRDRMVVFAGTGGVFLGTRNDTWALAWGTPVRDVTIDIRPGDPENVVNPDANGVLPVAILSDPGFDATTVDPLSVKLASAAVRLRPNGSPMAFRQDVNADGRVDFVLHIATDELKLSPADTVAQLTASAPVNLTVRGRDRVRVVGNAPRPSKPGPARLASSQTTAPALLGVRSAPGTGLRVSLAIAPGLPATLELLDVMGRRVQSLVLEGGGSGPREERLGDAALVPGVYWVRLRQAGEAFTQKAVVLR